MKPLTLNEARTIVALADNRFTIKAAAVDLGMSYTSVCTRISRLKAQNSNLFKYKTVSKIPIYSPSIIGLTESGHGLYSATKIFLDCLDLIQKENN